MAAVDPKKPVIASLLDRLIDDRPDLKSEGRFTPQLSDLRQSVRRDLENLLNSRVSVCSLPPELTELPQSVVGFGIPDISGADLGTERKRKEFLRSVQVAIRQFEPRFKSVRVHLLQSEEYVDRTLRFRIDAVMYADPLPETVVFDSSFEPSSGQFRVKGV